MWCGLIPYSKYAVKHNDEMTPLVCAVFRKVMNSLSSLNVSLPCADTVDMNILFVVFILSYILAYLSYSSTNSLTTKYTSILLTCHTSSLYYPRALFRAAKF